MMLVVKGLIVVVLLAMIGSPKYFFRWLDKELFKEPEPDMHVSYVEASTIVQQDSATMERDEATYAILQQRVRQAANDFQKRLWQTKIAQFERQMRWKSLVEFAGASERGP